MRECEKELVIDYMAIGCNKDISGHEIYFDKYIKKDMKKFKPREKGGKLKDYKKNI